MPSHGVRATPEHKGNSVYKATKDDQELGKAIACPLMQELLIISGQY